MSRQKKKKTQETKNFRTDPMHADLEREIPLVFGKGEGAPSGKLSRAYPE